MSGERRHAGAPFVKDLGGATGIGAAENRAAEMIQHYRRIREGGGQRADLAQLRMINPGVEGEVETGEMLEALAELRLREHRGARQGLVHARIRIPRGRKPNRMKAPAAGSDMRFEDRLDARA